MLRRKHLRPCSWLALIAMLALALLPTLSRALAERNAWAELCTPQGMRLVAVAAAADGGTTAPAPMQPTAAHLDHCPLCSLQHSALALPPVPPAALAPPALGAAMPLLFWRAPHTAFAWRQAQPRGPPVFIS